MKTSIGTRRAPNQFSGILMALTIGFCVSPWGNGAIALLAGVMIALALGNPFTDRTKILSQKLLTFSIIGLGADMNLITVAQAGLTGLGYTAVSIIATLSLGYVIGKLLRTDDDSSILISVGTAICGGSAIAAVSPVIKAKPQSISVALGTVFLLNAVALFIFPPLGHFFGLSQKQFGLWSALAVHDTSSVVGTTLQYGSEALAIGTTVKLARALWIVPLTIAYSLIAKRQESSASKPKKPWFILGFLMVAAIVTWVPATREFGLTVAMIARKGLIVTLFLIGSNLTASTLRAVGFRPLLQGFILWLSVLITTLAFVKNTID